MSDDTLMQFLMIHLCKFDCILETHCESPLPWIHWRWWIWMIIMFHIHHIPFTCFLGNEVLKYSLNAGFLKPRQMSWSQWGNCSCWLVATICHCPRDQFEEQWRQLDTVGGKMRGRRKSQWVSRWDSEWWKLWCDGITALHVDPAEAHIWCESSETRWSYGNQNLWALSGKYAASELFERGTEEYVLKQARKARRCDSCLQIWKYMVFF